MFVSRFRESLEEYVSAPSDSGVLVLRLGSFSGAVGAALAQAVGELRSGGRSMEAALLLIADFLDLVTKLRETESSKFTQRDTPIFTCIQMPMEKVLEQLF